MSADPKIRTYLRHQEKIKSLIFLLVILLIVLSVFLIYERRSESQELFLIAAESKTDLSSSGEGDEGGMKQDVNTESPEGEATAEEPSAVYFPIHLEGAVLNPGVYQVKEGTIINEVVAAAGGLLEDADSRKVNLASLLSPHQQIYIPRLGEELRLEEIQNNFSGDNPSSGEREKININLATQDELCRLSGVGAATAKKIIAYREQHGPFKRLEDIMQVPGIKAAKFEAFKDDIRLE
ncbi:MAG: helix-hairpin-helix domain-containing protein [Eubacteriales bacterium]|nr:helix-hairpin-helix domain-containing protein [Eubacteriales bacterium]